MSRHPVLDGADLLSFLSKRWRITEILPIVHYSD